MVYSVTICFAAKDNNNDIDFASNSMDPYYKSVENQFVDILIHVSNKAKYVDICHKNRYNDITMYRGSDLNDKYTAEISGTTVRKGLGWPW